MASDNPLGGLASGIVGALAGVIPNVAAQKQQAQSAAAPAPMQAPPQQVSLYDDPAYQAYMRQSQLQTQTGLMDAARQQAALNQILQVQLPGQQRDQAQQQKTLANQSASRGVFRSGEYLRNASQLADQQGRQNSALVSQYANGVGNLSSSLAQQIAQQQAAGAEQSLQSQQKLQNAAGQGGW